ncbi:unnamed protein product, partial [Symbiodinium sp. CCMP2456]
PGLGRARRCGHPAADDGGGAASERHFPLTWPRFFRRASFPLKSEACAMCSWTISSGSSTSVTSPAPKVRKTQGRVYHDFYAGTLKENGGPLDLRASLVKKLSEFAFGNEGDPEGYAYPQPTGAPPALPKGAISPTSSLELIGNFFYHAHSLEQCPPAPTCANNSKQVPLVHYHRVAPLHMRKAFCNYYHFTTVALS